MTALRPPAVSGVVSFEVLQAAFRVRARSWLDGRADQALTWPDDEVALTEQVGVPCRDCLEVVTDADDRRHRVRYLWTAGEQWTSGISASCADAGDAS